MILAIFVKASGAAETAQDKAIQSISAAHAWARLFPADGTIKSDPTLSTLSPGRYHQHRARRDRMRFCRIHSRTVTLVRGDRGVQYIP
jgi:hypothetical protein